MKLLKFLIALIALILFLWPPYAGADEEIPIRVKKISDQVIVLQTGLTDAGENITAIAADRGIIVIDTSSIPTIAVKLKKRIEEEFGRDDFLFVINTHHHFDHTNGNQVFPEALIVGHDRCENAMRKFIARLDDFIAQRDKWIASLKNKLKTLEPDSQEAKLNREHITFNKRMVSELKKNYVLTPPQLTFSDERTMNLGNMTLKMLYYGKAHTDNDIIIHVPEIGMLMVGDLFFKTRLPYISEKKVDVSRWLEVLSLVLDGDGAVKHVIPGHGEIMEADEIRAMRNYIKAIWEGVGKAQKDGLPLSEAKTLLSFEEKFKHLDHLKHEYEGKDFHQKNIEIIWNNFPKSSVSKLETLINEKGIDLACTEFQMNIKKNDKYYFNEKEFNILGYRLINSSKIREAVEVFKLAIEIFPRSWNLYDSLGEAYIYSGDKESAVKSYKKSLLLNPKNENGKRKLKNIDIKFEEIQGETKDIIKLTILYDNYVFTEGTKADWGFSCLIEGTEKTILFDTGMKSDILFHNIDQLKVDLKKVEQIVISHNHGDHTGGLFAILEKYPGIPVYLPYSFPDDFVRRIDSAGGEVITVNEPMELCKNVFLTGEMGDRIKEHSVILNTQKGLVIITGCSHPGIVNIVKKAKEILNKNIYLLFGGFHLMRHSEDDVKKIIKDLKELGVLKCGATHCTGNKAIQLFQESFGKNYVKIGTGRILKISKEGLE